MEATHGSTTNLKRTISVVVENKFGVLARIATLFAARGFNIDSLAVGETEDPEVSRMTIVASGAEVVLEQVEKQLNKLIDVIKVTSFVKEPSRAARIKFRRSKRCSNLLASRKWCVQELSRWLADQKRRMGTKNG
jgi:acetolactate synthase small subunit